MNTAAKIKKMKALEKRAQALQTKLDKAHTEWEKINDEVKETAEWAADCEITGQCQYRNFGDILC